MSVLVNGSPTVDFKVARGLRHEDPLSPFLFLIVVEGLAGLMRRVVDIGKFKGYQVNNNIRFQMLQFADDTILMGEGTRANQWTIKTLLRSFELVSGLKINFVKSKLYGVNIDPTFLAACELSCLVGHKLSPSNFWVFRSEQIREEKKLGNRWCILCPSGYALGIAVIYLMVVGLLISTRYYLVSLSTFSLFSRPQDVFYNN
jgi:hypothetical protein